MTIKEITGFFKPEEKDSSFKSDKKIYPHNSFNDIPKLFFVQVKQFYSNIWRLFQSIGSITAKNNNKNVFLAEMKTLNGNASLVVHTILVLKLVFVPIISGNVGCEVKILFVQ